MMKEQRGARINQQRVREALNTDVEVVVAARTFEHNSNAQTLIWVKPSFGPRSTVIEIERRGIARWTVKRPIRHPASNHARDTARPRF